MEGKLSNILHNSTCLNSRQMRDYMNKCMTTDECHAVEHHLNNCGLCSEAIEGMSSHGEAALHVLSTLDNDFLKNCPIPTPHVQRVGRKNTHHKTKQNYTALILTSLLLLIAAFLLKEYVRL
jgi:hypothetical protein